MNLKQGQFYAPADRVQASGISKATIFFMFAAIIWVANFWYSASFGLYEDDWGRIPTVDWIRLESNFH